MQALKSAQSSLVQQQHPRRLPAPFSSTSSPSVACSSSVQRIAPSRMAIVDSRRERRVVVRMAKLGETSLFGGGDTASLMGGAPTPTVAAPKPKLEEVLLESDVRYAGNCMSSAERQSQSSSIERSEDSNKAAQSTYPTMRSRKSPSILPPIDAACIFTCHANSAAWTTLRCWAI